MVNPSWDDPQMFKGLDPGRPWGRKLRRHQSWYRDQVLGTPPATRKNGSPIPNQLREVDVVERPSLNFLLNDSIAGVVEDRLRSKSPGWGGQVRVDRLKHNLLTSQALCFNLFGFLGLHRESLASLLRDLGYPVDKVSDVRIEYNGGVSRSRWGPNSAFDAWILYASGGKERFLGIECKYHEDLNAVGEDPESGLDVFRDVTARRPDIFLRDSSVILEEWNTRQLWFNACLLLAAETEELKGSLVLTSCKEDEGARDAFGAFSDQLADQAFARTLHYEDIIETATNYDDLASWTEAFHGRYLAFEQSGVEG